MRGVRHRGAHQGRPPVATGTVAPGHLRAAVREDTIAAFLDQLVLGHDRGAMLQAHLSAPAAEAAARRDARATQVISGVISDHKSAGPVRM